MTKKEITQAVQDKIAMEKAEIKAARVEFYREFSMHGGDGPWNNYGEDEERDDSPSAVCSAQSHKPQTLDFAF